MDIMQAKLAVIEAGKKLVETGLIARTWGNVSCRISDTQFVITPSGRDYLSLTPDDIVVVNLEDLTYEGDIKPSSERVFTHSATFSEGTATLLSTLIRLTQVSFRLSAVTSTVSKATARISSATISQSVHTVSPAQVSSVRV